MIPRERLAHAFSLRRNARALWDRPASHLAPLDGLRALSILWVLLFHTAWFGAEALPLASYRAMLLDPRFLVAWRGHFGVDVFFVLSGFLIAGMLLEERERNGRIRLGLFYVRRLLRLWPALLVAIGVYAIASGRHREMLWANALYVSNFVPVLQASMGWTWSLGIEEHFYLVCPWLIELVAPLGARGRVAAIALVALALAGVAASVAIRHGYDAMDFEIVLNRPIARWADGYDHTYSKPWMRVGPLLAGVAAAMIYRHRGAMDALGRARVLGTLGLLAALVLVVISTQWAVVLRAPRAIEVAYLALYRTVFGASVAYVMLFSISAHPLGRWLGRALGARVLHPIAQLAYSAYLLNPIMTRLVQAAVPGLTSAPPTTAFLVLAPLDALATFAAAALVYVLVERPFMELRPRGVPSEQRAAPRPAWIALLAIALLAIVLPALLVAIMPG